MSGGDLIEAGLTKHARRCPEQAELTRHNGAAKL
jgi:hypothetical protein